MAFPGLSTIDRVRRDVERNALRARNGIRMATGVRAHRRRAEPEGRGLEPRPHRAVALPQRRGSLRPPLLIVFSLISRSYILDLTPGQQLRRAPGRRRLRRLHARLGRARRARRGQPARGLRRRLHPRGIERVRELSGSDEVNLFGYCFGGNLALLHAAHHPDSPLRSLTVLATPVDFRHLGPLGATCSRASGLEEVLDDDGIVPPSVILQGFRSLTPIGEVTRCVDLLGAAVERRVRRRLPGHDRLGGRPRPVPRRRGAPDCEACSCADNAMVTDRLFLGGDQVRLSDIRVPFLHVLGQRDHIVPPAAAAPVDLVGSTDKQELRLDAGHIGLVVGRSAARNTLPVVVDFLKQRSEAVS